MKRLRHPIRAIREPFGTAGLIVACVALVAALGGTALAASKLNSTQKKEVEKIAKKYAGKPGATGPQGAPGAPGKDGTNGTNGTGTPGANGKSVAVTAIQPEEAECEERGGALVKQEGAGSGIEVCNGEEGKEGSPWTAGGTLPSGKTETGNWSFAGPEVEAFEGFVHLAWAPISFPIPLAAELPGSNVVIVAAGAHGAGAGSGCPATSEIANPQAEPGFLCVFRGPVEENISSIGTSNPTGGGGVNKAGVLLDLAASNSAKPVIGSGTWAVTAP